MTRDEDADADAFSEYMVSRWDRLLRTAYLLTGNQHDGEDLAQAALARAYSRWRRVRAADDPDAYVWRIMLNLHTERRRRLSFLRERPTGDLPEDATADASEQVLLRGVLRRALALLPPRQRAVVVLRYLEDRSETEVARLMGTSIGTVRTHAFRALTRLRADSALHSILPVPAKGTLT
jgi:RNA polymerase sigma-70 factor (sigma-E family)